MSTDGENPNDSQSNPNNSDDGSILPFDPALITGALDAVITDIDGVTSSISKKINAAKSTAGKNLSRSQLSIQRQIIERIRDVKADTDPVRRGASAALSGVLSAGVAQAEEHIAAATTTGTNEQLESDLKAGSRDCKLPLLRLPSSDTSFPAGSASSCPNGWNFIPGYQGGDDLCVKEDHWPLQPFAWPWRQCGGCPPGFVGSIDPESGDDICMPVSSHHSPAAGPQTPTEPPPATPPTSTQPPDSCPFCGGFTGDTPPVSDGSLSQQQPRCNCCDPPAVRPGMPGILHPPASPDKPEPGLPDEEQEQPPEQEPPPFVPPFGPRVIPASIGQPDVPFQCQFDVYVNPFDFTTESMSIGTQPVLSEAIVPPPEESSSIIEALSPGNWFAIGLTAAFDAIAKPSLDKIQESLNSWINGLGCTNPLAANSLIMANVIGFIRQWIAPNIGGIELPYMYQWQRNCPTAFPSSDMAQEAFLADEIDFKVAESWANINNQCTDPWVKVLQSRRAKPNQNELAVMRHRKIIDASKYFKKMRELGYLESEDQSNLFDITKPLPPLSELIRYMVRDVADPNIVEQFNLSAEFGDKFQGNIKRWAEDQGIAEDIMLDSWRAHWVIPGANQLFEMFHRLRPGAPGVNNPVTRETVATALKQQDILPFWIEPLLDISFRPLTRIDVRRAFDIGSLDENAVVNANQDLGYSPDDAETLKEFAVKQKAARIWTRPALRFWRAEAIGVEEATKMLAADGFRPEDIEKAIGINSKLQRNHTAVKMFKSGCITRDDAENRLIAHGVEPNDFAKWLDDAAACKKTNPALRLFRGCIIDRQEAEQRLRKDGFPDPKIADLLDDIEAEIEGKARLKCVNGLVERFQLGEFDLQQLQIELDAQGIPPACRDGILRRAQCEQDAKGKMPGTAQLCRWLELGLINAADMFGRLQKLGWNPDDALRIVVDCLAKINAKLAQKAKQQAKQQGQDAKKEAAQKERMKKKGEKIVKDAEKNLERARRAEERREKALIKAADKLAKIQDTTLEAALDTVKDTLTFVRDEFPLTIDEAYQAVILAIDKLSPDGLETLQDRARLIAETMDELPLEAANLNGLG